MAEPRQPIPPAPPYYYYPPRRSRWWIPVLIIAIIIAFFFLIFISFTSMIGSFFTREPVEVKQNTVLYLDLGLTVSEYASSGPFSFLRQSREVSYLDLLYAIKKAKTDNRIKGIYYKGSITQMGSAKTAEFLTTLDEFKSSGKFVYAFIEAGREAEYMKALPANKIFMPREGVCELNGYSIIALFFKGLLDKVGVDFYVQQFEDYKSAGEQFSRKNFSEPAREEYREILNQRYNDFLNAVVKYRKMDRENVVSALNRGIYTADTMLALGFIDQIASESDVRDMMKDMVVPKNEKNRKLHLLSIYDYIESAPQDKSEPAKPDQQIAIVYGVGSIVTTRAENIFGDDKVITSSDFIKNLRKAKENKDVKVIIIRIDSPGGSVIASDAIWEEIRKTSKVKPVYASMSDVAASGGYYMAIGCDTIIASPSTLTGSIGVIMMMPNVGKLLDNIHITVDTISTGPSAKLLTGVYPFNDKEKDQLYRLGKGIYDRFLNKVAESRHKTYDEVRAVAKGRVWSGEAAYKLGLVDTLGGLYNAIAIAKRRIGVPESKKVRIQIYPRPEDDMESLLRFFGLRNRNEDDDETSLESIMSKYLNVQSTTFSEIYTALPDDMKQEVRYFGSLINISRKEKVIMAMPYLVDIK